MGRFGEARGRDASWRMRPSARSPRHVARPLHRPGMDSFGSTGRARVLYVPGADPDDTNMCCVLGAACPGLRTANCRLGLGRGAGSSGDPVGQALLWIRAATPSKIRLRPNCKSS